MAIQNIENGDDVAMEHLRDKVSDMISPRLLAMGRTLTSNPTASISDYGVDMRWKSR